MMGKGRDRRRKKQRQNHKHTSHLPNVQEWQALEVNVTDVFPNGEVCNRITFLEENNTLPAEDGTYMGFPTLR